MNPYDYLGQQIDLDGYPSWQPYQCFDWANFMSLKYGYNRFTGEKASGIYGQQPENYDWVANSANGVPPEGSIVVWDDGINGSVGHVAVGGKGSTPEVAVTLDQNWGQPRVIEVKHNYNHIIGWGIPKNQGGDDMVKPGADTVTFDFGAYVGSPPTPEQSTYYLNNDIRQLYFDTRGVLLNRFNSVQAENSTLKNQIADLQKQLNQTPVTPDIPNGSQPKQDFTPTKPVINRTWFEKIINLITKGYYE